MVLAIFGRGLCRDGPNLEVHSLIVPSVKGCDFSSAFSS
jgi:hypothetical protein